MNVYDIEPRVNGDVRIGASKGENVVWAGKLAERGNSEKIFFDGSDNFVVLEVGKRGSGKSYGMGSLLEGFAVAATSQIGTHSSRRAVLLLDPLDIHWTALEPLRPDGPAAMARQYEVLAKWKDLKVEPLNVRVFVPGGYELDIDPPNFASYQLPVSDLDAADWAHLLDCDLVLDPRGRMIGEVRELSSACPYPFVAASHRLRGERRRYRRLLPS